MTNSSSAPSPQCSPRINAASNPGSFRGCAWPWSSATCSASRASIQVTKILLKILPSFHIQKLEVIILKTNFNTSHCSNEAMMWLFVIVQYFQILVGLKSIGFFVGIFPNWISPHPVRGGVPRVQRGHLSTGARVAFCKRCHFWLGYVMSLRQFDDSKWREVHTILWLGDVKLVSFLGLLNTAEARHFLALLR